jgi:hypothetical protein
MSDAAAKELSTDVKGVGVEKVNEIGGWNLAEAW